MNAIVHIFRDVSMCYQHDGLRALCKKEVDLQKLKPGEHVIFLNTSITRIKMWSAGDVISYYRAPDGNRLNLNMIEFIPQCFNAAKGMDWKKADKLAIDKLLAKVIQ